EGFEQRKNRHPVGEFPRFAIQSDRQDTSISSWRGLCTSGAGGFMSVAKVSEISCTSTKSFEDAINQGIARTSKTVRNVKSAWVKEQQVRCDNGRITEYQVNLMVTFVLED